MLLNDLTVFMTLLLLIGVSGFFSAAEIGLMGISRYRARQWTSSPAPAGRALAWLLAHPATMLGAILVAITTSNYIAEAIATSWVIQRMGREFLWLPIVGMAVVVIVFAEIVPILYASANADRIARFVALPVRLAALLLAVPVWTISALGSLVGGREWPRGAVITMEELRAIVSMESEQSVLEEEEKEMLHSIFEFADKVAKDVMVPRENIVAVSAEATLRQVAEIARPRRLSRLPVFRDSLEQITGIVFVKDLLLPLKEGKGDSSVIDVMRPHYTVLETRKVSELLTELRRRKQMLAIVIDRQGRTVGLVTVEDLLEEIVGDIFDEYDLATPAIERCGETIVVDGRTSIEEVSELLGKSLPEGRYSTIAGLFLNRFGTIPREGERLEVDGFILTAARMDGSRIARVRISLSKKPAEDSEGNPHESY
jgi:CBS domain containing-hemolysin-like protein